MLVDFLLILLVWGGLSIATIVRLRNILANLRLCLRWRSLRLFGRELLVWPQVRTLRPLHQLLVWFAEIWLLILWYSCFGQSIVAHVVAAVTAASVTWLLRDKRESNPLRAVQLWPMRAGVN